MSFNTGAQLDTSQVSSGGRGSSRGGVIMGGGAGGIVLLLLSLFFGQDLTGGAFDPGQITSQTQGDEQLDGKAFEDCKTGEDANNNDTCRIIGTVNSVQAYWGDALPADTNHQYRDATTVIYSGATQSACGTASNQTGPFYCPSDERVYIDAAFFNDLQQRYGADGGTLAQMYVVAHEYGHHIENIIGVLAEAQDGQSGPESNGVRIELMADCMAGVWAMHASETTDAGGVALIEPLTETDINSALSAAAAVGDDQIQKASTGSVNRESWTHGSSEQRQRWFLAGYKSGNVNDCDTFSASQL